MVVTKIWTLVVEQVNCPPVAVALGAVWLAVTTASSEDVQPLLLLVTTSV